MLIIQKLLPIEKVIFFGLLILVSMVGCNISDTDSKSDSEERSSTEGESETAESSLVVKSGLPALKPGESEQLDVELYGADGATVSTTISYSSADPSVAKVDKSGKIEFTGIGATSITASATVDGESFSINIPVVGLNPSGKLIVGPPAYMGMLGDDFEIVTLMSVVGDYSVTYKSLNEVVATVSNSGFVTLKKAGTATIQVTGTFNGSSETGYVAVTVLPEITPPPVLGYIKVTRADGKVEMVFKGDQVQLKAQGYSMDGKDMEASYSWSTSVDSVATIDSDGLVSTKKIGITTLSATAQGVRGNYLLEVLADTVIVVTPLMANIGSSQSKQFMAQVMDLRKKEVVADAGTIKWGVFDPLAEMLNFGNDFGGAAGIDVGDMPDMNGMKTTITQSGLVSAPSTAIAGGMMIIYAELEESTLVNGGAIAYVGPGVGLDFPEATLETPSSNITQDESSSETNSSSQNSSESSSSEIQGNSSLNESSSSTTPSSSSSSSDKEVIEITPKNEKVSPGETLQLSANVVWESTGETSETQGTFVWAVQEDPSGGMFGEWPTIDSDGLLSVPASAAPGLSFTVEVSIEGNTSVNGMAVIAVPLGFGF
ncbi:MAG: Ig-like domain-containing protein [Fibrobacterales bacterium]